MEESNKLKQLMEKYHFDKENIQYTVDEINRSNPSLLKEYMKVLETYADNDSGICHGILEDLQQLAKFDPKSLGRVISGYLKHEKTIRKFKDSSHLILPIVENVSIYKPKLMDDVSECLERYEGSHNLDDALTILEEVSSEQPKALPYLLNGFKKKEPYKFHNLMLDCDLKTTIKDIDFILNRE